MSAHMTGGSDFTAHNLPVKPSPDELARATAYVRRKAPDLLPMLGLDTDAPSAPSTGSRRADYARRVRQRRKATNDAQGGTE